VKHHLSKVYQEGEKKKRFQSRRFGNREGREKGGEARERGPAWNPGDVIKTLLADKKGKKEF